MIVPITKTIERGSAGTRHLGAFIEAVHTTSLPITGIYCGVLVALECFCMRELDTGAAVTGRLPSVHLLKLPTATHAQSRRRKCRHDVSFRTAFVANISVQKSFFSICCLCYSIVAPSKADVGRGGIEGA